MKCIEELPDLMVKLIESVEDNGLKYPALARELISEIAEYARNTQIYKESKDRTEQFWSDKETTPRTVWLHMLDRVANAPTLIHRDSSVMLTMPVLDALLNEVQNCRVCGCTWDNACEGGCYWVEEDLCSQCADLEQEEGGNKR